MCHHARVLTRSDTPILEYDPDPRDPITDALLAKPGVRLPERAVLTFLGKVPRRWAETNGYVVADTVDMVTGRVPVWVGRHQDREIALVEAPVGAPPAVIVLEFLLMRGVRTVVGVGSCGGLVHFEEGQFVLPARALRDEGTSYHYQPASRWVDTDAGVRAACKAVIEDAGLTHTECPTWTTDAFFRETRALIAARTAEGCQVVDMECAALAACAAFRGARFAQLFYTADTLVDGEHDARSWGMSAREVALELALAAAVR